MANAQTIIDETNKSKARSFSGYSFPKALARNKDAVKSFLAIIGGLNLIPPFSWKMFFISMGVGLFALAIKIAADAVDFYASEVDLTKK